MKIKDIKLIDIRNRCDQHCKSCPYFIWAKTKFQICILDIILYRHLYDEDQEIEEPLKRKKETK